MDTFWVVTLFHLQPKVETLSEVEKIAMEQCECLGIEEFSLNEEQVDNLLGDRSYSGGDLPMEVIDEVNEKVLNRPANYRFFFSSEKPSIDFVGKIKSEVLCEIQTSEHKTEDWNAEWKKHYSPIKVNNFLEIVPSWETNYIPDSREKIMIYPGMGFGTGSHETTFLCLKLFTEEALDLNIKNVLDFGSGSGILGLSVFKFYPNARVDFFDIDPEANKNCFQNAELNEFTNKEFRLLLPEVKNKIQNSYDIIFANILESILLEEKTFLIERLHKGSLLILSGLLTHQMANIISNYSNENLHLISKIDKGDWGALLFRKES